MVVDAKETQPVILPANVDSPPTPITNLCVARVAAT